MLDPDTSRLSRLTALLTSLQAKRIVTAPELARQFQVSVRTVYRDIRALEAAGVPTGRVQDMAQAMRDPQVLARNMILPVAPRPGGPEFVAAGNPIKMTGLAEAAGRPPAPDLDGDRAAILAWLDAGEP